MRSGDSCFVSGMVRSSTHRSRQHRQRDVGALWSVGRMSRGERCKACATWRGERRVSARQRVIPSERSESRDLHLRAGPEQIDAEDAELAEGTEPSVSQGGFNANPKGLPFGAVPGEEGCTGA